MSKSRIRWSEYAACMEGKKKDLYKSMVRNSENLQDLGRNRRMTLIFIFRKKSGRVWT
jgi:hypothetical protein